VNKGFSATAIFLATVLFIITTITAYKFSAPKKPEPQADTNSQITGAQGCNGLAYKLPEQMEWSLYQDAGKKFSIDYPSALLAEQVQKGIQLKTTKDKRPAIIWFYVYPNPKNQNAVQFWTDNPPNDHAGELATASYAEKANNAKSLIESSENVNVGQANVKGYRLNIPDVLEREEIFWLDDNNIYNLGFSPQDTSSNCIGGKKRQIVNYMLRTFKQIKTLEELTADWNTYDGSGFSFKFPRHLYIDEQNENVKVWRSNFGDFYMSLKTNNQPQETPQINRDFTLGLNNHSIKVSYINEEEQIEVDGKTIQRLTFGCLFDCEYQMVSFSVDGQYYQLIFDVAGGGLKNTFDQIIKTIKFSK